MSLTDDAENVGIDASDDLDKLDEPLNETHVILSESSNKGKF